MPMTVLVIDDDPDIRDMLHMLLHDEGGYAVIAAADPAGALDILHTTPHHLIVLFDYRKPRTDGVSLLALAEQEAHLVERHAFVCMTDANSDGLPLTLLALLAHYQVPVVAKPFDIDNMLTVIRSAEQRLAQRSRRPHLTPLLDR
jgi:DNA-binding NtrC family response regulator